MTPRMLSVVALLAALEGCAANEKGSIAGAYDTANASDGVDGSQALRLDIYPSDAGPSLEAQSWQINEGDTWQGLEVALLAPITLQGTVTGYAATPPSAITVPGSDVPVIARVEVLLANSIAGAATSSTADGAFSLVVTPGSAYQLSVVPIDPALLPFLVSSDLTFTRSQTLDPAALSLGYGVPVYGVVTTSDGNPLRWVEVSLVDPTTGVAGPSAETDSGGYYQLRSFPGTWTLEVEGLASKAVPTVTEEVTVDAVAGARADVDMGNLNPVSFGCQIADSSGAAVSDATVRLTATSLADPGWSLARETEPDQNGDVLVRLLPGSYTAEFIPDYDLGLSPVVLSLTVGAGGLELPSDVVLPDLAELSGRVVGPSDEPLANVAIAAHEVGFNGQVYSGTSDANGSFSFDIPAVPLDLSFTPATSDVAIFHTTYDPSTDALHRVTLQEGALVSGTLLASGAPVPYAVVEIHDAADGTLLGTTLSAEDGSFAARVAP